MSHRDFNSSELVAATANRLRMVLVDFADSDDIAREDYLAEQIERSLTDVLPDQREAFLASLMEQFPSWDSQVDPTIKKAADTERAATDERELSDPNYLVARLIKLAPELSDDERGVLIERLREAGLSDAGVADWSAEDRKQLRHALQLKDEVDLELPRAMEAAAMLIDFASQLDQLAWNAWRAIHPQAALRRAAPLRGLMGRLLRSDADVSRDQVKGELARLGGLLAAITSGVRQAGLFTERHLSRFSPGEIERLVAAEGSNIFSRVKEARFWAKYVELWNAASGGVLENEIRDAIAQYVESLMKNR